MRDVARGCRSDEVLQRRATAKLFSLVRAAFPTDCLDFLAASILINLDLLMGEEIVCNPLRSQGETHYVTDDSVLVEMLSPVAPTAHMYLIVRAINVLRSHHHWYDRSELKTIWQSITPPLPPLQSFQNHRTIFSAGMDHIMFRTSTEKHESAVCMSYHGDSHIAPLVFGLTFMSWAEHLALAFQCRPPLDWASLTKVHTSPSSDLGTYFRNMDPIVWRLLRHLMRKESKTTRDTFINSIKLAVQSVRALQVCLPRAHSC